MNGCVSEIFKDMYYCLIEIIKGLTYKGQFQYLTKLMGSKEGTYLYTTQFHSLRQRSIFYHKIQGAQWLRGRVLDSRPKGRGFEPHRRHCVVVLEQDTFILV